ncbi:uncharacterized protein Eint_010280 [Encephalitozoon intestinalis ATCC 50506]|uniref:Uncharacterized protein n=1 Tax=Encephalitozoon intestinalis (strain ATCC 50506) TaxID=876142 RepID=E0S5A6_ENCIT|nr:uncharacterized protein Eint_010280 [Encephalitozoon intestinalis ATCC 50506]ADM10891.1 hypothetical protein Eint_010280 [Encephalitozoon intestinalis ATCC 50506]UTX44523.1 interaptin-like protein [Encephalitozoon intestinalis]
MGDYDAINDEIKNFLSLTDRSPREDRLPSKDRGTNEEEVSTLIDLLTGLQNVYSEINTNLAAGDGEGLKNILLNSDVKMSLVCESLMRVLKDVSQEKVELVRNEEKYKEKIKKFSEEKENLEIKVNKMESDLEFANRGNQELSRIIKDQKNKIQGFKEKADLEKRNCDSFRSINEELEILRKKALEKCDVYEKEIGVLKEYIKERSMEIGRLKGESKESEEEREGLGKKIVGLEKINEMLRKKLELKENAIGMCNSELSKLISKEKRMENELEKTRERASYYERLYKATNNQNEYLNRQLSKMIKDTDKIEVPEYDPNTQQEVTAMSEGKSSKGTEKSDLKRIKRYRRRISEEKRTNEKQRVEMEDLGREIEGLKGEVSRLQEERTKIVSANSKMMEELMSKIEKLLEKNREYQNVIYELRGKGGREEKSRVDFNESFRTVNDGENDHREKEDLFLPRILGKDEFWRDRSDLKPLISEKDYKEKIGENEAGNGFGANRIYGEGLRNIPSRLSHLKKQQETGMENRSPIRLNLPDSFFSSLAKPKEEEGLKDEGELDEDRGENREGYYREAAYPEDPFGSTSNKYHKDVVENKAESDTSGTSPKTIRTTSTLHEMLRRTDALQEKFDKLEDHLNAIKSSDKVDAEKVHDQIEAYKNYYYSDYLDMSNESDVI